MNSSGSAAVKLDPIDDRFSHTTLAHVRRAEPRNARIVPGLAAASYSQGFRDLEGLEARLRKLQDAENAAVDRLNAISAQGTRPTQSALAQAMFAARAARVRAVSAYDAWCRGVECFH
jgi:hypothetical protein